MEIDLAFEIEVLNEAMADVINALPDLIAAHVADNPELLYEISEETIEQVLIVARDVNNETRIKVLEAISDLFDGATDLEAQSAQEAYDEIIEFYVRKTLGESSNRIQSATVARQILDDDRPGAITKAVEISIGRATDVATSEVYASSALFEIRTSLENGFSYYRYRTSEDEAVRSKHNDRNNKVFAYGRERVADDVPGLAHACRCFSFPLTDEEVAELSLSDFFYPEDAPAGVQAMKKNDFKMQFRVGQAQNNVEVTGTIGDYWEYNDFASFKAKVDAELEGDESKELVLDITSHGGYAYEGLASYSYLSSLPNRVIANIYGFAGSAATAFIAAADHVTAGHADQVLIHKAWTFAVGSAEELRKTADEIDVLDDSLVKAYQQKTGQSRESIIELMEEDAYISAERAKEFGLVDEIREKTNEGAKAQKQPLAQAVKTTELEGVMSDKEQAQLEQELNDLKAAKADVDSKLATAEAKIEVLNEQITVLKANESTVSEQAKAEAVEALKAVNDANERVTALGLKPEGETAGDVYTNALKAKGRDVSSLNEAGVVAVFETIEQFADQTLDSEDTGKLLSGKDDTRPMSRAEHAKQLQGA